MCFVLGKNPFLDSMAGGVFAPYGIKNVRTLPSYQCEQISQNFPGRLIGINYKITP
nr:hypothetical protein [Acinetobacter baumannii]